MILFKSHMSRCLSERSIVSIEVALVHVPLLSEASDKDPEAKHDEDALPHSIGNLIPHLLIEQMNLLQSLKIVDT